jgi:hypothetical protein
MALSKQDLTKEEKRKLKSGQATLEELYQARQLSFENTSIIQTSPIALDKITILCVRFGNKYGREYVERLRNMVSRHLTVPYEFACLTDDQHPIQNVKTIYQPNANYPKGWWHKVHMFDANLPLRGRILYFDLDVVICANIDKLCGFAQDQFVGIHDFNRKFYASWKNLNSSVLAWNHGSQSHIYEQFKQKPADAQRLQGDQDWIWKLCQNKIKFWPKEWIQSYKWEIRNREELAVLNGKRQFKTVKDNVVIHPECSVAVFHGDPNPCAVQDKFVIDNWR